MKISNLIKGAIAAALVISFAGCSVDFDATERDFSENEKNYLAAENDTIVDPATVTVNTTSLTKAGSGTIVELEIDSKMKLDKDAVLSAISFYSLADNTTNKFLYPAKTAIISTVEEYFDRISYFETPAGSGNWLPRISTTISFVVDTSTVATSEIAVIVDATKVTTKAGNLVMNGNGNETAGEESDSFIKYIPVALKSDGNPTTALSYSCKEEFAHDLLGDIGIVTPNTFSIVNDATTGNPVAARLTVQGPSYPAAILGVETDDTLAALLNSYYTVEFKAPDSSEWVAATTNFAYNKEAASGISAYTYTADFSLTDKATGTKYRLVTNQQPDMTDTKSVDAYGHQAKLYYGSQTYKHFELNTNNEIISYTSGYFTTSKTIVHTLTGATTAAPTQDGNYARVTAEATQNQILSYTEGWGDMTQEPYSWIIHVDTTKAPKGLATYSDFIVRDSDYVVYPTKVVAVENNGADGVTAVKVILDVPNIKFDGYDISNTSTLNELSVWVGKGTTLVENLEYPTELEFGTIPDSDLGNVSGYTRIVGN